MSGEESSTVMGVDMDALVRMYGMVKGGGVKVEAWIGVEVVDNFPDIENGISFTSTLHAIELVML